MIEGSWIDRYVPDELRMALGDLVIVEADVESAAYGIARIYRVPEPQKSSAKRIIGKLESRIGDLGTPPWADVDRKALFAWSHAARLLLQERDLLIHASMTIGGDRADGKSDTFRWSLRDRTKVDSDDHHVERLVQLFLRVRRVGMILEYRLCYPDASGGRMPPEYVTFGRTTVPPWRVPVAWTEWAERAAPEAGSGE